MAEWLFGVAKRREDDVEKWLAETIVYGIDRVMV